MHTDRRSLLARATLALGIGLTAGAAPWLSAAPAAALSEDEATKHVRATIDEVVALVGGAGDKTVKAPKLLAIMERRAAMPEIARFAAGTAWRSMDDAQQSRYTSAFAKYLSSNYAGRFEQYAGTGEGGEQYTLGRVVDSGKRGLMVSTTIFQKSGPPVAVDWLVTDRPGRVVIADIVIEGISMLVTEREEIAGMLEARGGDLDKLISDLGA